MARFTAAGKSDAVSSSHRTGSFVLVVEVFRAIVRSFRGVPAWAAVC